eukprot:2431688-Prymnesium_polylepis.1
MHVQARVKAHNFRAGRWHRAVRATRAATYRCRLTPRENRFDAARTPPTRAASESSSQHAKAGKPPLI